MSNEIIKVLDVLAEKFGLAVDWTAVNVMPYLEQLCGRFIKWEIATSITWIVINIITLIVAIIAITKVMKYVSSENYDDYDDEVWTFVVLLISTIAILSAIIAVPYQIFDIIECLTIPEKTIIEYLYELSTNA